MSNTTLLSHLHTIPGFTVLYKYTIASYQGDPLRLFLEILLVLFMLWYFFTKRYSPGAKPISLSQKEINDLVQEWEPEPLVPPLTSDQKRELESVPVFTGTVSTKATLLGGKSVLNFTACNFLGVLNCEAVKEKAIKTLKEYGVGSCGPPGFYGTLDVHTQLEQKLAAFMQTEAGIIYSQGFSTLSSVIPAFAKRGDVILADAGVSFAIQKGLVASRSIVKYFNHNDMDDLERLMQTIEKEDHKGKRRFLVVEGVYADHSDIVPLKRLVELKKKYKYRIIIDESYSIGALGKTGRGVTEEFGVDVKDVDIICSSMSNVLATAGGFVVGSKEVVDHQRLSAQSYTFSASLPAILAVSAIEALDMITPDKLEQLHSNVLLIRHYLSLIPEIEVEGKKDSISPIVLLRLKSKNSVNALQDIVDQCVKDGVLISRAKYVEQELKKPEPVIRICVSSAFSKRECEKLGECLKSAAKKVAKNLK